MRIIWDSKAPTVTSSFPQGIYNQEISVTLSCNDNNGNWHSSWLSGANSNTSNRLFAQYYNAGTGWDAWDPTTTIKTMDDVQSTLRISDYKMSLDSFGNVIYMWSKSAEIQANYYDVVTDWSAWDETSTLKVVGSGYSIQLATDNDGNTIAAYRNGSSLATNRFEKSNGWKNWTLNSEIIVVEDTAFNDYVPNLKMDTKGNAIVLALTGSNKHIAANYYDNSKTWDNNWNNNTVKFIDSNVDGILPYSREMQLGDIVFDGAGNALLVYAQPASGSSAYFSVWAYYFDAALGWGQNDAIAKLVDQSNDHVDYQLPRVIVDTSSNVFITWLESLAVVNPSNVTKRYAHLWGNRIAANEWNNVQPQNAVRLDRVKTELPLDDPEILETKEYKLQFDDNGRAILVWYQETNNNLVSPYDVWVKRFE